MTRPPLRLLLLVGGLVVLAHGAAARGDAGVEHLEDLGRDLLAFGDGRASDLATGGGPLYTLVWWLAAKLGLPWWGAQAVHGLLDLLGVFAFVFLAPRDLPRPVLWLTAAALALDPIPKVHLVENSALVAVVTPPLLALMLRERLDWWATVAAAALLGVALHLSLVAAPLVPLVAWRVLRRGPGVPGVAAVGGACLLAVAPLLLAKLGAASWVEAVEGEGGAGLGGWSGLLLEFLLWPSTEAALLGLALGSLGVLGRERASLGLVWTGLGLTILLLPNNDGDRYHLAGAAAGVCLLAGAGGAALLKRMGREEAVAPVLLGLLLLTGVRVAVADGSWRGEEAAPLCGGTDAGVCDVRTLKSVVDDLEAAGWSPESSPDLRFGGVFARCLDGVWAWESAAEGRVRQEGRGLILLPEALPGAVPVGERLFAFGTAPPGRGLVYTELAEAVAAEAVASGTCRELRHRRRFRTRDGGAWMVTEGRPVLPVDAEVRGQWGLTDAAKARPGG